jgi:hypothetical protein
MTRIVFIIVCFFSVALSAQEKPVKRSTLGFGLEASVSNNGHGSFFEGHLTYSKGRNTIRLGPCIHKRSMEFSGVRLSYAYVLAGMDGEEQLGMAFSESNNGSCRISLYTHLQYIHNTKLSYQRAKEESVLYSDSIAKARDWNQVRLSTVEVAVGAQIDVKLLNYIQWRTSVGLGAYSYLNYIPGMYQEQTGLIFFISSGIDIPTFRRSKKER